MFVALLVATSAGGCAPAERPASTASTPASSAAARLASSAPSAPPSIKGIQHEVVTRLAAAIDAGDAEAAAATFAVSGVLVRHRGKDARGPAEIAPVFRQAFGLCKMRVVGILERSASVVMQLESMCAHPGLPGPQNHLLAIDVMEDRIARAAVLTEIFPKRAQTTSAPRRELEDSSTLTPERESRAACIIDREKKLLPADFKGTERAVWATPTCTVMTVKLAPPSHGYTEVECSPRSAYCDRADDSHRYVDWNGYRLLPFADPDEVYVEKTR